MEKLTEKEGYEYLEGKTHRKYTFSRFDRTHVKLFVAAIYLSFEELFVDMRSQYLIVITSRQCRIGI